MDIAGSIQGAFNQANQASRQAEAERAKNRKAEQDRVRDARRQYISTQEEVVQTQTLRGSRVDPDPEATDGQDARDQYEGHRQLTDDVIKSAPARTPPVGRKVDRTSDSVLPSDDGSGSLIDLEA